MIFPATFIPVAVWIPSNPGVEFTSKTKGPLFEDNISTPQTCKFNAFAVATANCFSVFDNCILFALPPWCKLDLKISHL